MFIRYNVVQHFRNRRDRRCFECATNLLLKFVSFDFIRYTFRCVKQKMINRADVRNRRVCPDTRLLVTRIIGDPRLSSISSNNNSNHIPVAFTTFMIRLVCLVIWC